MKKITNVTKVPQKKLFERIAYFGHCGEGCMGHCIWGCQDCEPWCGASNELSIFFVRRDVSSDYDNVWDPVYEPI